MGQNDHSAFLFFFGQLIQRSLNGKTLRFSEIATELAFDMFSEFFKLSEVAHHHSIG